jgi:GNAT superfamily N-acetyltransferase
MDNMIVREAVLDDLDALVELQSLLQVHCERSDGLVWRITEEGKRLLRQKLKDVLEDEESRVFIAEADGETVGYASGQASCREDYLPRRVASISNVFVRGEYRKRGVGRRLVMELCRFFDSTGAEQVTLRYIVGNGEAESFWTKLGFKPIIITASITSADMEKNLSKETP